ncbi:MAG: hypothetical protein P4L48_23300 [Mycobacterium sp.]|nr:hypothetical protein [Mycobacterium sp.]
MFPPTTDYNQQLLAYLQAWQQLLQQWAAMTPGLPYPTSPFVMPGAPTGGQFMPPAPPFMPPTSPVPPMPPAPADYTQQLFSYLQAWRQYLEQMVGARPGSPQASNPQQPTAQPANDVSTARPPSAPDGPIPPGNDTAGKAIPKSDVGKGANSNWPVVELPPESYYKTEFAARGINPTSPFDHGPEQPHVLSPPDYAFGYEPGGPRGRRVAAGPTVSSALPGVSVHTWEAPAEHPLASSFRSVVERVEPNASPQPEPRSLFSSPGAQTASETRREAGQQPSS